MRFAEFTLIGLGLAMDAFSVSVSDGMNSSRMKLRTVLGIPFVFAVFQMIMPVIGYHLGCAFESYISAVDHYLALVILGALGIKMIIEALRGGNDKNLGNISLRLILVQAFATSIDALAVGISFAALGANIFYAAGIIGAVTFICCAAGIYIGKKAGNVFGGKAEIAGGIILIIIGAKIFLEHTLA